MPTIAVIGDRGGAQATAAGLDVTLLPMPHGRVRPLLVCPKCQSRRLRLYPVRPTGYRCRVCLALRYVSQSLARPDRWRRKAAAIRARLGGPPDPWKRFPRRPPGMHRATYQRLRETGRELEALIRQVDYARECLAWFVAGGRARGPDRQGARACREVLAIARRAGRFKRRG